MYSGPRGSPRRLSTLVGRSTRVGASEEVFEEEIVWSELVEDTEFEVGDRRLLFNEANAIGHYSNGAFAFGTLVEPLTCTVRDTQIRLAAGNYASFWRDGSLKATYVSVEHFEFPIQGKPVRILGEYDFYSPLMFRESGELHYGILAEPTAFVVQNREVACKRAISFHDNGLFRLSTLVEDSYFSVEGREIVFEADRLVRFTDEAVLHALSHTDVLSRHRHALPHISVTFRLYKD